MKKFLAIGHWRENKNATICVAMQATTKKDFRDNLGGNGFVPYVVISEKKMEILRNVSDFELFAEVKKMTSNYRKWDVVCDYIDQCFDIMEEKMANAQ